MKILGHLTLYLQQRPFIKHLTILEEKMQDTDAQNPICLEVRVLYEDAEGTRFCSLHDIEYGPGAKKVRTSLKRNGEASEV